MVIIILSTEVSVYRRIVGALVVVTAYLSFIQVYTYIIRTPLCLRAYTK